MPALTVLPRVRANCKHQTSGYVSRPNKAHEAPFLMNWMLLQRARRLRGGASKHQEGKEHGQVRSKTAASADYSRGHEQPFRGQVMSARSATG